jgi:hypothetical protein
VGKFPRSEIKRIKGKYIDKIAGKLFPSRKPPWIYFGKENIYFMSESEKWLKN